MLKHLGLENTVSLWARCALSHPFSWSISYKCQNICHLSYYFRCANGLTATREEERVRGRGRERGGGFDYCDFIWPKHGRFCGVRSTGWQPRGEKSRPLPWMRTSEKERERWSLSQSQGAGMSLTPQEEAVNWSAPLRDGEKRKNWVGVRRWRLEAAMEWKSAFCGGRVKPHIFLQGHGESRIWAQRASTP